MGSDSIRKDINRAIAKPVWDQPNPKKTSKSLSADDKAAARARAAQAGRPYPNLIDNMWAARKMSEAQ
jgi:hypothetical protein